MDPYSLLGVVRTASDAEIERAYRRLVRRYHPGVNPGDSVAEAMYHQVQEAYGVLADAEQRRRFDNGSSPSGAAASVQAVVAFEGFDFHAQAEGPLAATFSELFADVFQDAAREATTPTRGLDIEVTAHVSFLDAARGSPLALSVTRQERCGSCLGEGRVGAQPRLCPVCGGEGARRWSRGHMVFTKTCEACGADGRLTTTPCRHCAGGGTLSRTEMLSVPIPAGIEPSTRVSVPGRGHAGARGGPAGDLYVTVDVAPHPHFGRRGRDLMLRLPVTVHEAILGAEIDVPTLDGHVRLTIPAGSPSGRLLRVRGAGLSAPSPVESEGDLLVELQIVVPEVVNARSRELIREFASLNDDDVRCGLFG